MADPKMPNEPRRPDPELRKAEFIRKASREVATSVEVGLERLARGEITTEDLVANTKDVLESIANTLKNGKFEY